MERLSPPRRRPRTEAAVIRTTLSMIVRPGREREFERTWLAAAEQSSRRPGALGQALLRDPSEPRHYTVTADWATHEDLAAYQASDHRVALSTALEQLRESAARSVLEVVAQLPPAQPPSAQPPPAKETPR
ncbi:putative quinol monooxygenase [Kitasatospora purpeofusca]|uniref:putative quinol monooxygenase n=1 Tax=Kitasatospora purpeofusca TaxID=67352 RepID=UPI003868D2D7|nr:antibiotic biosynthesis monooxygenase [Kitasatospora purpeofusca]